MILKEDTARLRRLYLALVQKGQAENGLPRSISDTKAGYENHHIQPVLWGGSDHRHNLVRFTYRQHYIAHLLLASLMRRKFNMLASTSRDYANMKERLRNVLVAMATTDEARARAAKAARKANNKNRVQPSKASNALRSESLKGRVYTCPHCGKSGGGGMLRWHFDKCKKAV